MTARRVGLAALFAVAAIAAGYGIGAATEKDNSTRSAVAPASAATPRSTPTSAKGLLGSAPAVPGLRKKKAATTDSSSSSGESTSTGTESSTGSTGSTGSSSSGTQSESSTPKSTEPAQPKSNDTGSFSDTPE